MDIQSKIYTIEEFQEFEALPEHAGQIFELIDGEIIQKMPSFTPSRIASRINRFIGNFVDARDLGYVTGADGGYVMSPGNVFNPDVGFISKKRLPTEPEREAPVPPDMAVEVKSPTD